MFALRLLFGLLKGVVVGGLVGWGLAALGFAAPAAWMAYVAAAVVGVLVGLIAGKPVWAEDSNIQVYLKMGAGALLGPGLMFAVRQFLTMATPFSPDVLPGVGVPAGLALGAFSVTSLAIVGAVLAAFYDADNTDGPKQDRPAAKAKPGPGSAKKRVSADLAAITGLDPEEIEAIEAERERSARD